MAAHLLAFPPEPQGRRERRWRPRSEPSFPEKPLSLFVLPLPGPPTLGCSFPALGQRASAGQRRGQGRTRKRFLPSLSPFPSGAGEHSESRSHSSEPLSGGLSFTGSQSLPGSGVKPAATLPPPLQSTLQSALSAYSLPYHPALFFLEPTLLFSTSLVTVTSPSIHQCSPGSCL